MLIGVLLKKLIKRGTLRMIDSRGKLHVFAGEPGRTATIRMHDARFERQLFWNPRLRVGEGYMDGRLTLEEGTTIRDFVDLVGLNIQLIDRTPLVRFCQWVGRMWRPVMQHNPISRARKNVAHHYDLSTGCSICFSIPTVSIPAAIIQRPTAASNKPRSIRSAISPRSFTLNPAARYSTSARAGAGLVFILPRSRAPT